MMKATLFSTILMVFISSYVMSMPMNEGMFDAENDLTAIREAELEHEMSNLWLSDDLHHRARRSPQDKKGSVVVSGSHTKGQFGQPSQQSLRGEYNHNLWRGRNGATVDANAYYQRNWGGGPRQDYGGGVRATIPFGRR